MRKVSYLDFDSFRLLHSLHERWQGEWVAAILDAEDAQEEAVYQEEDQTPDDHCDLLSLGVGHARNFDSQGDGAEREHTVYYIRVSLLNMVV